ncbi:MAG: hypothetical protein E7389_07295 [Ruminococcaceae bacterium]|nr:hypothetical protein [Oscillospiraceae bacterium]
MAYKVKRRRLTGKKAARRMEQVAEVLDISKDFLAGTVKITVIGTEELTVEGEISIIEYTDISLRLNTRSFILSVSGNSFEVTDMDTDYIRLKGNIENIGYLK